MSMTFADPTTLSETDLEAGTTFSPRFDAHGLVTAIATDHLTNEVLMVGFMNAEALSATIETGHVHYYSRSRQKLWMKGETSGEIQRVVEIRTDCDQDAILLLVEQTGHGAACHTGHRSCFYRRVEAADGRPRLVDTGEPLLFDPRQVYR